MKQGGKEMERRWNPGAVKCFARDIAKQAHFRPGLALGTSS